jgi:hypothetical protein
MLSKLARAVPTEPGDVIQTYALDDAPMGITVSPSGQLYLAFPDTHTVGVLEVTTPCAADTLTPADGAQPTVQPTALSLSRRSGQ